MTPIVLVTGASGFIGRNTLVPLLARGYEVHAVTSQAVMPSEAPAGVHWHHADLLDSHQVTQLLSQIEPTVLLHLAWYAAPADYGSSPTNLLWLQASLHLVNEFVRSGGRRLVVAGTCAEYDWRYGYCTEELTPLRPANVYGICKHSLQLLISSVVKHKAISTAWGRIFWLYGPNEYPQRLVASIIRSLLKGEPALCTHGNQIRDFAHVEDMAGALVALLDSDIEGPVNIASGKPVAVREIALSLGQIIGRPDLVRLGARQAPPDEPQLVGANITRLANEVGWSSHYDLIEGLSQVTEWWREQAL